MDFRRTGGRSGGARDNRPPPESQLPEVREQDEGPLSLDAWGFGSTTKSNIFAAQPRSPPAESEPEGEADPADVENPARNYRTLSSFAPTSMNSFDRVEVCSIKTASFEPADEAFVPHPPGFCTPFPLPGQDVVGGPQSSRAVGSSLVPPRATDPSVSSPMFVPTSASACSGGGSGEVKSPVPSSPLPAACEVGQDPVEPPGPRQAAPGAAVMAPPLSLPYSGLPAPPQGPGAAPRIVSQPEYNWGYQNVSQLEQTAAQLRQAAEQAEAAAREARALREAHARARGAGIEPGSGDVGPSPEAPAQSQIPAAVLQAPQFFGVPMWPMAEGWPPMNAYAGYYGAGQPWPEDDEEEEEEESVTQKTKKKSKNRKKSAAAGMNANAAAVEVPDEERTTLMLRNIPNNYTRQMLLELLDEVGLVGKYDFVYLPMDFKSFAGLGYAFVNLVTHDDAVRAKDALDGFANWKAASEKVCAVAWGQPLQGFQAHVERYRNSPVMHPDVPEKFKPAAFHNGQKVDFPEPTKRIPAPRCKRTNPEPAVA